MNPNEEMSKVIELSKRLVAKMNDCKLSGIDPLEHPEVRAIMDEINSLPSSTDGDETRGIEEREAFDKADLESGHIEQVDAELEWEGRRDDGERPH